MDNLQRPQRLCRGIDEANGKLLMRMEKPKFLSYLGLPRLLPASKEIRASGPYEKGAFPAELG